MGTGYPRLSLLPMGSPDSSIASLLHSPRALEFLNRMREEFHTVIIDSPPMLQMADARVLGKAADAVILVLHSAETTRDAAATAALRLTEDGTRVLGSILNEWDPRKSSHSGYGVRVSLLPVRCEPGLGSPAPLFPVNLFSCPWKPDTWHLTPFLMTPLRRRLLLQAAKLFDLLLMVFSFGLATVLVAHQTAAASLAEFFSMRIKVANFVIFALLLLGWHIVFYSLGVYSSKRLSSRWAEVFDVVKAATLGSAIIFIAAIFLHIGMVTPYFILIFWAASTFAAAASRVLLRPMLKRNAPARPQPAPHGGSGDQFPSPALCPQD